MIEEKIASLYHEQEMRCPVHLSIGQEANAVTICDSLNKNDYMVSTHRGHAHYLAKGGSLDGLLGELYGKSVGCSGGNGGSMHLTDHSVGFLGSTSIVGGTIPIGVGAAFSAKLKKQKRISVICIGDAAIEEGVFHECANFAALHHLPVIFFMENNNYSCFTSRKDRQPKRDKEFRSVAEAHGMDYIKITWENFYSGHRNLQNVIKYFRECNEKTPIFVECEAYRFVEHCGPNDDDNLLYRPAAEIEHAKKNDPIIKMELYLRGAGFLDDKLLLKLKTEIEIDIEICLAKVRCSYYPMPKELGEYIYA